MEEEKPKIESRYPDGKMKRVFFWITSILLILIILFTIVSVEYFYLKSRSKPTEVITRNDRVTVKEEGQITNPDSLDQANSSDKPAATKTPDQFYADGVAAMAEKNWPEAIAQFDNAIALDSTKPVYYSKKSQAEYSAGEKGLAIETLKDGLITNPNDDLLKSTLDVLEKPSVGSQPQ